MNHFNLGFTYIFQAIEKTINDMDETFRYLQEAIKSISSIQFDFDLNNVIPQLSKAVQNISNKGWTIDVRLTPATIVELGKLTQTELDNSFVLYYEQDNYSHFDSVFNKIIKHKLFAKWETLLRQCKSNIKLNNIEIVIPCLLIIFEGVLADMLNTNEYGRNLKNKVNEMVNNRKVVNSIICSSVINFFNILNESRGFDEDRPDTINRHRILHGRDIVDWSKADAYRLFNAFYTIVMLSK